MENFLKIAALFFLTVSCKAQTIIPINSLQEPNTGGYLKDLDNQLPFWVDTWKGTVDNKEYTFEFTFFAHYLNTFSTERYYYIDELMGKFKVVDLSTNTTLYNDLSVSVYDDYKIRFLAYNDYNGYSFGFYDDDAHCGNSMNFLLLKNPSNPNQVTYMRFEYDGFHEYNCPYADILDIPMFLPKVELVLTRQ